MKICFKYIPIKLGRKGKYYPNYMIEVSALEWKAVVYDESNYPLKSPNTIYEYGFIDIIDSTIEADVQDLISTLWVAVWMKKITVTEMQDTLELNGYTEVSPLVYEIVPASVDDLTGEPIDAILLDLS